MDLFLTAFVSFWVGVYVTAKIAKWYYAESM